LGKKAGGKKVCLHMELEVFKAKSFKNIARGGGGGGAHRTSLVIKKKEARIGGTKEQERRGPKRKEKAVGTRSKLKPTPSRGGGGAKTNSQGTLGSGRERREDGIGRKTAT